MKDILNAMNSNPLYHTFPKGTFRNFTTFVIATITLGLLLAAGSATANTSDAPATVAAATAKTNSVTAADGTNTITGEIAVPISVFELSEKSHDPFFPASVRRAVMDVTTNAAPLFKASTFTLKALSGPAGHRLALINNRTVAQGEKTEITTPTGKFTVYCEEIKENSVIVRTLAQPDPVEIFFRKGAQ
jgi:hypothetical protein